MRYKGVLIGPALRASAGKPALAAPVPEGNARIALESRIALETCIVAVSVAEIGR